MLRMIVGIYTLGIVVVFGLLLFLRPKMPLLDAVFTALVWPYGAYVLIASKVGATVKSGMLPVILVGAQAMRARPDTLAGKRRRARRLFGRKRRASLSLDG